MKSAVGHLRFTPVVELVYQCGICAFLLWILALPVSAALDSGNELANSLWQSFKAKYHEFSLKPLAAGALDAKARAALIGTAGPQFRAWKPDRQPTFPELLDAVMAKDPSSTKFERTERALTALLPQIDKYGYYKSAADIAQWQEALKKNRGSIQMTLDQASDGRILCYPAADGPAAQAGVKAGAQLLAVDQRPAEGKTFAALRLEFVGQSNTEIELRIKQPHGKIETLTITRSDQEPPCFRPSRRPWG